MKSYFVTGTDTNVGKTHVARMIARAAVLAGKHVFAFKPIETGCPTVRGELVGGDGEALAVAAGDWQRGPLRGLYRFSLAAAPHVAAGDTPIDLDQVDVVIEEGGRNADLVLVEGAGGWRVPITDRFDMSSLARRLNFPVIVVARATLGTLNHSLLTLEAIARDGLQVAALILSKHPNETEWLATSNLDELRKRANVRVELVGEMLDSKAAETLSSFF